jgi:hypothetical protein
LSAYEYTDEQHHGRRRHDCHQPRPEARRASAIERAQIDGAGLEFADQQGGDEKPRQAKEHGHADKAVDQRPRRGVLAEDQKNCHGTDAIQPRKVALVAHDPTLTRADTIGGSST